MTKTEITNTLHKALDKQFKIYTFNSNKPMPVGLKGLPDHLLINNCGVGIWFLEVKIGKDKESDDQRIFREMIQRYNDKGIYYRQITESNLAEVIAEVYGK